MTAMAHLTCVGASQAELGGVLDQLEQKGVQNVIALRGDIDGPERDHCEAQEKCEK